MSTTLPGAELIKHADFCTPRPGETAPRIEAFPTQLTDELGRPARMLHTTRCLECAEQVVIG